MSQRLSKSVRAQVPIALNVMRVMFSARCTEAIYIHIYMYVRIVIVQIACRRGKIRFAGCYTNESTGRCGCWLWHVVHRRARGLHMRTTRHADATSGDSALRRVSATCALKPVALLPRLARSRFTRPPTARTAALCFRSCTNYTDIYMYIYIEH